ncbi:MAG: polyribonucleotide nucleotidyltransferase [Bacteroidetes bacterium]|nr:polyribonucleotide nucleotidyltransferase [Bacteroidota bacterium]MCL5738804.1 polyribonucleotide nucleotidyltransferase [Bacteroidota bacterium]
MEGFVFKEIEIGGRKLSIETGRFAKQASGAVMVRYADTLLLATVVAAEKMIEGTDFIPLSVEYREKTAAAGKFPGGFIKREGRPNEKEVLSARLIDRPIRPLFPKGWRYETQVVATVFSFDGENDSDVLGAIGASTALMISDIPFDGPIAEVRIGRAGGQYVVNPLISQLEKSDMDLTVAGTEDSIVMVEGEAREISESEMIGALEFAHKYIKEIVALQKEFAALVGRTKRTVKVEEVNEALVADVKSLAYNRIRELNRMVVKKAERSDRTKAIKEDVLLALAEKYPEQAEKISEVLHDIEREDMRQMILKEGRRLDGRGYKDVRPIACEVGLLPRTHGSALFTRGETQSLTSVTLGTKLDEQTIDGLLPESSKRFMLHYNFPGYSVGEVARMSGPGRREIGHGNLAERALKNLVLGEKEFPYTVRIVSDILESNGSSSMATVCAGSLALMDAGVPIAKSVAGIAMGLIKEGGDVAVITDILGNEDHLGDMDFKVAGTRDGITAFQMDIKIRGISFEIMARALAQAKEGRYHILGIMEQTISEPRKELSPFAPRMTTMKIPIDMIGAVIGPGGKVIKNIVQQTGAEVNIEDDGSVVIAAVSSESSDKAREMIERLVESPEVGKVYKGTVKRLMDFGAFVEFLPGKEGLLHISQIDHKRVNKVEDVFKVGDEVEVKLMEKDDMGRYNLSRKVLIENPNPHPDESGEERDSQHRHSDHSRRGPRR